MNDPKPGDGFIVSRRSFLKSFGTTAAAAATAQVEVVAPELQKANAEQTYGPGAVPITLKVNGKPLKLEVEPRVTLLDALRNHSNLTGAKEVCDRAHLRRLHGVGGRQTGLFLLEARHRSARHTKSRPSKDWPRTASSRNVQQAFVDQDALMCGYCTPGFVMSVTALLQKNPRPTADQVKHACSGNLCRCGTYPRILQAALQSRRRSRGQQN